MFKRFILIVIVILTTQSVHAQQLITDSVLTLQRR
jgi:hypothetical protein